MNTHFEYEEVRQLDFDEKCSRPDFHAVTSIQLCELIDAGFFDLSRRDWDFGPKFSQQQHEQLCHKITEHYYYREISLVPPGIWKREFLRKMNEIMPKYIPWYKLVSEEMDSIGHSFDYISGDGKKNIVGSNNVTGNVTESDTTNVVDNENTHVVENGTVHGTDNVTTATNTTENSKNDEYLKARNIFSDFPQTMLAGNNQDYASTGNDSEYEKINENTGTSTSNQTKNGQNNVTSGKTIDTDRNETTDTTHNAVKDSVTNGTSVNDEKKDYRETREHVADPLNLVDNIIQFDNIDAMIIEEIEPLFSCLFTVNINGF
jgi:hypothetical protein